MNEILKHELTLADNKAKYNEYCKELLSCRQILTRILQGVTEEFRRMPLENIAKYIEGVPELSTHPVFQQSANTEKIIGIDTVDTKPNEGTITYDIRFTAYAPSETDYVKLYMNLEAQKNFHQKYSLTTRGVYYGARMISSQYGVEFTDSEYDKIKKVYSIWICHDTPKHMGNSIIQYSLKKDDLVGHAPDKKLEYDKLTLIFIYLNEKAAPTCELTGMLNTIFSETLSIERKLEILTNDYHMELEDKDKEVLNEMCNFAEGLIEKTEERVTKEVTKEDIIKTKNILLTLNLQPDKIVELITSQYEMPANQIYELLDF